jgi:hypothetical protein
MAVVARARGVADADWGTLRAETSRHVSPDHEATMRRETQLSRLQCRSWESRFPGVSMPCGSPSVRSCAPGVSPASVGGGRHSRYGRRPAPAAAQLASARGSGRGPGPGDPPAAVCPFDRSCSPARPTFSARRRFHTFSASLVRLSQREGWWSGRVLPLVLHPRGRTAAGARAAGASPSAAAAAPARGRRPASGVGARGWHGAFAFSRRHAPTRGRARSPPRVDRRPA